MYKNIIQFAKNSNIGDLDRFCSLSMDISEMIVEATNGSIEIIGFTPKEVGTIGSPGLDSEVVFKKSKMVSNSGMKSPMKKVGRDLILSELINKNLY